MNQPHRYSGPELSALLAQVRSELGAQATIHEANKIRTGGLAGFFASESFEVIASPGPPEDSLDSGFDEHDDAEQVSGPDRALETVGATTARASSPIAAGGGVGSALLDRADAISIQERIQLSRPRTPHVNVDLRAPSNVGPFGSHLQRELGDEMRLQSRPQRSFWAELRKFEDAVTSRPLDSGLVTVIGNLDAALQAARSVVAERADADLLVVTTFAEVPGVEKDRIVRNSRDLGERLRRRTERELVVVLDIAIGSAVESELERLRHAGCGLVRLAIDESLSARKIFGMLHEIGGNVVLDVAHEAEPLYLLGLISRSVPLVSVAGRRVDPSLLLALTAHVTHE